MDLSDEVCLKIKSAIKARLKELGIIWDRELPDYVMVLIKNKKSKEQMENDLNIFLGDHTPGFTDWLCDVCQKLETCAVSVKGKSPLHKKENGAHETSPVEEDDEEDKDAWEEKSPERGGPLRNLPDRTEQLKEKRGGRERIQIEWSGDDGEADRKEKPKETSWSRSKRERSSSRSKPRSRSRSRGRSRSSSRPREPGGGGDGVSVLRRGAASPQERRYRERSGSRERRVRDARDIIRRRSSPERRKNGYSSRISRKGEKERRRKSRSKERLEEKLPSLVKVTPRPVRPLSMQPPPNLILKAVAEAQKSIAITTLPQPDDKLAQKENNKKPIHKKPVFKKKRAREFEPISITLLNDRVNTQPVIHSRELEETPKEPVVEEVKIPAPSIPEVQRFTISLQSDDDSLMGSDHEEYEEVIVDPSPAQQLPSSSATIEPMEQEPMDISVTPQAEETPPPASPVYRFDRSRLGPRVTAVVPDADTVLSCLAPSCNITKTIVNENAFNDQSETRSEDNEKLIKCKFWPSCETGDACRFYHPKTYCRALPNCKFGQKCLYIHPPCKFGENCLNVSCPYTHSAPTSSSAAPTTTTAVGKVWTKVPLAPSNGQVCMFFPNCTKPFCPYQHYAASGIGIPCKYGAGCTKVSCEFDHPQSSKNPYKWVAQNPE